MDRTAIIAAVTAELAQAQTWLTQGRPDEGRNRYREILAHCLTRSQSEPAEPVWQYLLGVGWSGIGQDELASNCLAGALLLAAAAVGREREFHAAQFYDAREHLDQVMARLLERCRQRLCAAALAAAANGQPRRSVIFFNCSYYNFHYLTLELRRRGWDALLIDFNNPQGRDRFVYFGEDINFYFPVFAVVQQKLISLMKYIERHYSLIYSYGRWLDHYPVLWRAGAAGGRAFGPDFAIDADAMLGFRDHGIKFAWTPSGCLEYARQSVFHRWSGGACDQCDIQLDPHRCSDAVNAAFAGRIARNADLMEGTLFALDYARRDDSVVVPLTWAIDAELWRPDLEIPPEFRVPRAEGEFLVYHAMANSATRVREGRNIKGTPFLLDALERLRAEGLKVRLIPVPPNTHVLHVRYLIAQADVVFEQMALGTYGATARESLMLGKPVLGRMVRHDLLPEGRRIVEECPLVNVTAETLADELKALLLDPERRQRLGQQGRAFALRWYSAEACATQFEAAYQRLMAGLPPGPAYQNPPED